MKWIFLTFDHSEVKSVNVLFTEETMADWDENKLEEVVNKKHGESEKAKPKTSIVS